MIATDSGTIMTILGFGFFFRNPESFQSSSQGSRKPVPKRRPSSRRRQKPPMSEAASCLPATLPAAAPPEAAPHPARPLCPQPHALPPLHRASYPASLPSFARQETRAAASPSGFGSYLHDASPAWVSGKTDCPRSPLYFPHFSPSPMD